VKGEERTLKCDTIVVCAGQSPKRELEKPLAEAGFDVFKIGGAEKAAELDAKRAIDQGTRLAAQIEHATTGQVFNAPVGLTERLMEGAEKLLKVA